MSNQFGGPSASTSFLVNLASSTLGAFKSEHDKKTEDEQRSKEMDYQILMAAMKQMEPNLTPTQVKEIMTRGVDIFKPKGHGGIKDKLGEIFGGGGPSYSPQAGNIINDATGKPRANVSAPTQTATPGGTGAEQVRGRTVSLPAPPQFTPELTNREQDVQDESRKQEDMMKRQLAVEDARDLHRKQARELQNKAILERFKAETGIKDDARATLKVRERAALRGDPDDPTNQEWARTTLQSEIMDKKRESQAKLQMNAERIKQIDSNIAVTKERLRQGQARLSITRQKSFENDPQVKGSWAKVHEYTNLAKTARTQAAVLYGKNAKDPDDALIAQAQELEKQAEGDEQKAQQIMDAIGRRQDELSGQGVKLPAPPTGRRGKAKLTEAEIRAAGGTDATVKRARERGDLAP